MSTSSSTTGTAITGTGVWHPEHVITNAELCDAFNAFVRLDNERNAAAIAAGTKEPLKESSPEFIVKASGIEQRYVQDKSGLLDPERMCPNIPDRAEDQLSVQAEYAVHAAQRALKAAGRAGEDVDLVILAASNLQRPYPAIAIEVQDAIGARGYGYDIMVGCSSATFAVQLATEAVRLGNASCALVVVPEMTTGHMNWRDRDSHFIFGDGSVAAVVEPLDRAKAGAWEIVSTRAMSKYSSNIRNNGGYLARCDTSTQSADDKLFHQQGRRVFKDVVPMASKFIADHLEAHGLTPDRIARFWLHQANQNMNELVAKRLLGREATREEAPIILGEYGNTASAGSLIAFSLHNADLAAGSIGMMASFGAGYSLGSLLVRRV
ncbi:MAG TPA: beta-ketoacyl-ACP synthase III [Kofleriaceae bacterium]|nr:beta-ketoacyl-ACP synthase III [Kofleriaceae bacterium]